MLIATLPPQARHGREIAEHPSVDEVRLNTGVDTGRSPDEMLDSAMFTSGETPLLIDLKARQLRITKWVDPGWEHVTLNHNIAVDTPCSIIFRDEVATIVDVVDGNKLVLDEAPKYALGAGQSINIQDPSLIIEGFLTERDREFVAAAKKRGLHRYLLSFVEEEDDIKELLALDPKAEIICKIESPKGLDFVRHVYPKYAGKIRLMAARDDLYTNIGGNKLDMLEAEKLIIKSDPSAIVASRILTSTEKSPRNEVSLSDLKDLQTLWDLGYRNYMFSDGLCLNRDAFRSAVSMFEEFLRYRQSEPIRLAPDDEIPLAPLKAPLPLTPVVEERAPFLLSRLLRRGAKQPETRTPFGGS
ncbi:MAG: hypothetical protein KDD64_00290 [Bdellovibrionales bacterium]|nr:hypothetical protein [Bdellovibrionales bacterium]